MGDNSDLAALGLKLYGPLTTLRKGEIKDQVIRLSQRMGEFYPSRPLPSSALVLYSAPIPVVVPATWTCSQPTAPLIALRRERFSTLIARLVDDIVPLR